MSDENRVRSIELEISRLVDSRHELEKKQAEFGKQYTLAAIGFFLGVALLIFAGNYWYCGSVFLVAGAASAITQTVKKRGLQGEIDGKTKEISNYRDTLKKLLEA